MVVVCVFGVECMDGVVFDGGQGVFDEVGFV